MCFEMATSGLSSVCLLLEKHRDAISDVLDVEDVLPDLIVKGILNTEDEVSLVNSDCGRTKVERLINVLSKKGFAAFQEFCHILERLHPHLITCFLMDFAAGGVSHTLAAPMSACRRDSEPRSRLSPPASSLKSPLREAEALPRTADNAQHVYGTLPRRARPSVRRHQSFSTFNTGGRAPVLVPGTSCATQNFEKLRALSVGDQQEDCGSDPRDPVVLNEVLEEPVTERLDGERVVWEYHHVSLNRVPGYGFGIAVSGGRDNPHFTTGDPSIAISDVLAGGPAQGKLHVNDRVLSVNGVSLHNVDYGTAVQVLKDSPGAVQLHVKRRVVLAAASHAPSVLRITLHRTSKKQDFGVTLGCRIYVKDVVGRASSSPSELLQSGDTVLEINDTSTELMSLKDARRMLECSRDRLSMTVARYRPQSLHPLHPSPSLIQPPLPHQSTTISTASMSSVSSIKPSDASPDGGSAQYRLPNQNVYVMHPVGRTPLGPPTGPRPTTLSLTAQNNHVRRADNSVHDDVDTARSSGASVYQYRGAPLATSTHTSITTPHSSSDTAPTAGCSEKLGPLLTATYDSTTASKLPGSEYGQAVCDRTSSVSSTLNSMPDPRFVSFHKDGSVGIRLAGGNSTGIFVAAVQPGSPAHQQGLQPADKIIKVNGTEMKGVTREKAVLFLLALQDQVDLIVQHRPDLYNDIVASQLGDSFYIRVHFNHEQTGKCELSFRRGDIFHVVDTLNQGVVGAWNVLRIGRSNEETQKGVIPNKSRAEELAVAQLSVVKKERHAGSGGGSGFFSRRRGRRARSKSLGKDHWDDAVLDGGGVDASEASQFVAYECVTLAPACSFRRPVVLFGGVADVARQRLLAEQSASFCAPQVSGGGAASAIIRLSVIRRLVEQESRRHVLLDITPTAVERLNCALLCPICVLLRTDTRHVIKQVRATHVTDKSALKSSRKLHEQSVKLERAWSHLFTATITVTDTSGWYSRLLEIVDRHQHAPVWMSEFKPGKSLTDDYLFPMSAHTSCISSTADSDTEPLSPTAAIYAADMDDAARSDDAAPPTRLCRSSSQPSVAADILPPSSIASTIPPAAHLQPNSMPASSQLTVKSAISPASSDAVAAGTANSSAKMAHQTLPHGFRSHTAGDSAVLCSSMLRPQPPPSIDRRVKPPSHAVLLPHESTLKSPPSSTASSVRHYQPSSGSVPYSDLNDYINTRRLNSLHRSMVDENMAATLGVAVSRNEPLQSLALSGTVDSTAASRRAEASDVLYSLQQQQQQRHCAPISPSHTATGERRPSCSRLELGITAQVNDTGHPSQPKQQQHFRPVPPPKPRSYRPPYISSTAGDCGSPPSLPINDDITNGGGSLCTPLDVATSSLLDLARREQQGSAFQLYKKPSSNGHDRHDAADPAADCAVIR